MSVYKRKGFPYWHIRFTSPSGERVRCSSKSRDKTKAREFEDKLKAEAWRVIKLGEKPSRTWDEAALEWIKEKKHKADIKGDIEKLRWLRPYLRGKLLEEIDRDLIGELKKVKASESSESTANHTLALIRAILRKAAYDWEWIDKIPKINLYTLNNRRVRWLTRDEAERLIKTLPTHYAEMARFSLATGLRQANVIGLEWSQIDMQRSRPIAWIHPDQAKSREAISVPLNDDAVAVIRRQLGKHSIRVFTYKGRPIKDIHHPTWKKALDKAEIKNFKWHDIRHTWATWHIQSGTPVEVLQKLGGWKDIKMVLRYAHMGQDHLAKFANNSSMSDTKLAHCPKELISTIS